ncbi:Conserved hypothetical protein [Clostridium kluyveri DSM 555]|uniref:Uncharacterized protein n=2 Tax=Clostridium kluyveri TaxID=1534 RepID=A5N5G1_CLOK5|nr:Conserved hypothetical protein [Clostridium kluyveri DSM 555]
MGELCNLIKQYDEMVHKNPDMATEEQRLRIEKFRVEIEKVKGNKETTSNTAQMRGLM